MSLTTDGARRLAEGIAESGVLDSPEVREGEWYDLMVRVGRLDGQIYLSGISIAPVVRTTL